MNQLPVSNLLNKLQIFLIELCLILAPMDAWLMLPAEDFIVKISIPRVVALISFITLIFVHILNQKVPDVSGLWMIALWTAWNIFSAIWVAVPLDKSLIFRKLLSLLFANILIIFSFLMGKSEKLPNIFKLIIIFSVISALIEQFFGIRPYVERQHAFILELTGFYINPAHLGSTIALLSFWTIESRSKRKYFTFVLWLLSLFVIIRTGSKGAIIGLLIGIIVLALNLNYVHIRKLLLYIGFGIILFYGAWKINLIPSLLLEKIDIFFISPLASESYSYRTLLYKEMINYISQSPLIGYGLSSTSYLIGTSSHNLFLELWIEGGIFSLLLFISMYFILLFKLYKKKEVQSKLYFSSLIAFLPISLTVSSVFTLWSFWMVLGGSIYNAFIKDETQSLQYKKILAHPALLWVKREIPGHLTPG